MMDEEMMNKALRSPLAANDPSLGYYALSQAAWKAIKHFAGRK
ncbi:hypothetical protein [Bifidobacterium amazonense]|nr:hypothetical protein [Bifidobacterium amazonense]